MTRSTKTVGALLLATVLGGCDDLFAPNEVTEIGRLLGVDPPEPPPFEVPDTVPVGQPFTVSVLTQGGGCHSLGPTGVDETSEGFRVTPFDRRQTDDDLLCPSVLKTFVHEAELTFAEAGTRAVTFRVRHHQTLEILTETFIIVAR